MLASRVLAEAERVIPAANRRSWSQPLVEVGESVNLRIRSVDCPLDDALAFVREGAPVATCGDLDDDDSVGPVAPKPLSESITSPGWSALSVS